MAFMPELYRASADRLLASEHAYYCFCTKEDLEQRRALLQKAREVWRDATLLAVTHDIAETLSFERVMVVEHGRIVEDGDPRKLAEDSQSHLARMLAAEREVREALWSRGEWRRLRLQDGMLIES